MQSCSSSSGRESGGRRGVGLERALAALAGDGGEVGDVCAELGDLERYRRCELELAARATRRRPRPEPALRNASSASFHAFASALARGPARFWTWSACAATPAASGHEPFEQRATIATRPAATATVNAAAVPPPGACSSAAMRSRKSSTRSSQVVLGLHEGRVYDAPRVGRRMPLYLREADVASLVTPA